MQQDANIIFIFSMPRSGSTLLQKLLAAHSKIATFAEPWLLLPLLNPDELGKNLYYNEERARNAIKEFLESLPGNRDDYLSELGKFITNVYLKKRESGEIYFVDKTPNYYHKIDEIAKVFPEAKFIFLFRNPLSVYASIMNTWYNGKFISSKYLIRDIKAAPKFLAAAYRKLSSRSLKVVYDELVKSPEETLRQIFSYLKLEFEDEILQNFSNVELGGKYNWEKIGNTPGSEVNTKSIDKWISTFDSKYKKSNAIKYLKGIDESFILECDLTKEKLNEKLKHSRVKKIGIFDVVDYYFSTYLLSRIPQKKKNKVKYFLVDLFKRIGLINTSNKIKKMI
ncbi:MAG: sulfotransferase [Melioribacteraceae bacterium]|nr:sulfotransferase [Melioribacteraceae bacterium]